MQVISIILLVLISITGTVVYAGAPPTVKEVVSVVIYEDDSTCIAVQIPVSEYDNFMYEFENDEDFKNEQIMLAKEIANPKARYLTNGKLISEKRMYRSDVQNFVIRTAGVYNWINWVDNPLSLTAFGWVLEKSGYKTVGPIGMAADILLWSVTKLASRTSGWWQDTFMMLVSGQISYVRCRFYQNVKTSYPASWIIIERV